MIENMDDLLRQALAPHAEPDTRLNQELRRRAEERIFMAKKRKKLPMAILVASMVLVFGGLTAGAAFKYLSPAQVAHEHEDDKLEQAFSSEDAILINETQEYETYRVTLLGMVSGKNISKYLVENDDGTMQDNQIYAVTAIERTDGTPMPDTSDETYGEDSFYVSPYIKGLDPNRYSIMSMGGGYSEFVQDGILYRMISMDNIDMFADKGIYLGVCDGTFYNPQAYCFDEATGEITKNQAYQGLNALFTIPIDASKADPQAAKAYLENLEKEWETPDEPIEMSDNDLAVEAYIQKIKENPELLEDSTFISRIESTVQVCKPDENDMVTAPWETKYSSGTSTNWMSEMFPEGTDKTVSIGGYNYSDEGLESLMIEVWRKNEDGTATFAIYTPVIK